MTGKGKSAREGQKSGEYREEIDFEALARENSVLTFYRLFEDMKSRWWKVFRALEDGEEVDYDDLDAARRRCKELDDMVSQFLYRVGDLSDVEAREHGLRKEPEYSEFLSKGEE
jgi:hypothetical protein